MVFDYVLDLLFLVRLISSLRDVGRGNYGGNISSFDILLSEVAVQKKCLSFKKYSLKLTCFSESFSKKQKCQHRANEL